MYTIEYYVRIIAHDRPIQGHPDDHGTSPNPNRGSPLQVSGTKLQLYNAQQIGGFEKSLMFPEPEPDASPSWLAARRPTPEGAPVPSGPNAGRYRLQIQSSTKGVPEYGVGRLLAASAL
uniref:Uncharacterized protein n=1 Tax=Oryza barthii TaxID=65489 RepID=A0A0D3GK06_9ORYZ